MNKKNRYIEYSFAVQENGRVWVRITEQTHRESDFCKDGSRFNVKYKGKKYSLFSCMFPYNYLGSPECNSVCVRGADESHDHDTLYFSKEEFEIFKYMVDVYNKTTVIKKRKKLPKASVTKSRVCWVVRTGDNDKYARYFGGGGNFVKDIFHAVLFDSRKDARDAKAIRSTSGKEVKVTVAINIDQ